MTDNYRKQSEELYTSLLKYSDNLKSRGIYILKEGEKISTAPPGYEIYITKGKDGRLRIATPINKNPKGLAGSYMSKKDLEYLNDVLKKVEEEIYTNPKIGVGNKLKKGFIIGALTAALLGSLLGVGKLASKYHNIKSSRYETYEVKKGDSFWEISKDILVNYGLKNPSDSEINALAWVLAAENGKDMGKWGKKSGKYFEIKDFKDPDFLSIGESLKILNPNSKEGKKIISKILQHKNEIPNKDLKEISKILK